MDSATQQYERDTPNERDLENDDEENVGGDFIPY